MYRARAANLSLLSVIAGTIARLRRAGIEPVFVFDGQTPGAKTDTVEKRREVREALKREIAAIQTAPSAANEERLAALKAKVPQVSSRDRNDIKQLMYAAGVLFVTAVGEADDLLGYLARTGAVSAVLSTDMDMLARGVPVLVQPETPDATVMTEISLEAVLVGVGLTYPQFVDACMLMGADYTPQDVQTLPPAVAVAAIQAGGGLGDPLMRAGAALLRGDGTRWEDILLTAQHEKWVSGAPPVEAERLAQFVQENAWPSDWYQALSCGCVSHT